MPDFFIGLMSGTSLDGVDGVLVDFSGSLRCLAHCEAPFSAELRAELLALNSPGFNELHRAALAANGLAKLYAQVVADLLHTSGMAASQIRAIGAHGQTVRHQPGRFDGLGYTLQLNNPALLAELCSIRVVADFRSRDLAAGGQGAPLVPKFHAAVFAQPDAQVAVLNLGGMSNLSILPPTRTATGGSLVIGFDCGPANVLIDQWCQANLGRSFDADGAWAATGKVIPELLARMLTDPYFALPAPKSTGRDYFHFSWLADQLRGFNGAGAADVQATLTELTVQTCVQAFGAHTQHCDSLIVCGGGALNTYLMQRLGQALPEVRVRSSTQWGMPAQQVEACAFAWLARQAVLGLSGNLTAVTGACGERILGAIYPA